MLAVALAASLAAQDPSVFVNARLDTRAASGGLAAVVQALLGAQPQPAWIAYAAPSLGGQMCCFDSMVKGQSSGWCCGGCRLEGRGAFEGHVKGAGPIPLEGRRQMHVLLRVEQGRVARVAAYSADCALDAGGLPVHWLSGVAPAESVSLLAGLASGSAKLPLSAEFDADEPLAGLANHDDPSVDPALERMAASGPIESRKQAVFWMGQARGRRGYAAVLRIAREDPSDELREHAVFALSQSDVPEAVDAMIAIGKQDRSSEVRGQALFWLSQKAGRKAAGAISDAIRDDPETEVKEKAVFALSQLPPEEGVPELIRLARSHKNPVVRERAIFWLGQSEDPRALTFFEEVLAR